MTNEARLLVNSKVILGGAMQGAKYIQVVCLEATFTKVVLSLFEQQRLNLILPHYHFKSYYSSL